VFRKITYVFFILLALAGSLAHAQVLSPVLDRHVFEIGYTHKWYKRDFGSTYLGESEWSAGACYLRYGVCRRATIAFEGAVSTLHHGSFDDIDYRRYTIGGGLAATAYRRGAFRIDVSGHYSEIFDHDRSENRLHKNLRDLTIAVEVEGFFSVDDQPIILWAGPVFVYNQSRQYPWQSTTPVKDDTSDNFGFAIGVNTVLLKHVSAFGHLVYADTFRPRTGLGVQF
jgi:hypothetical protein